MENRNSQVNSETFRAVLGNYPTGVAVVTGFDPAGEPIGIVVGTFGCFFANEVVPDF